jgi:hypothetical protein
MNYAFGLHEVDWVMLLTVAAFVVCTLAARRTR